METSDPFRMANTSLTAMITNWRRGILRIYLALHGIWLVGWLALVLRYWPTEANERARQDSLSRIGTAWFACQQRARDIQGERQSRMWSARRQPVYDDELPGFDPDRHGSPISSLESALANCQAVFEQEIDLQNEPWPDFFRDVKHGGSIFQAIVGAVVVLVPTVFSASIYGLTWLAVRTGRWILRGFAAQV